MNTDSKFIKHEPCPNCGSSDALAVYDDGHKHCFSCKHHVKSNSYSRSAIRKVQHNNNKNDPVPSLPSDFSTDLPTEGLKWLMKYGLTLGEISLNSFGWSQQGFMINIRPNGAASATRTPNPIQYAPLLVMPIFDTYQNLLMWQARYFGSERRCPKYWTKGNRGCFHILGNESPTITLVEDLVSAVKVSRHGTCMPIFGSEISNEVATVLSSRFVNLNIWLDKDKLDYANGRSRSLQLLFDRVRIINTEVDPKETSDADIRERIR